MQLLISLGNSETKRKNFLDVDYVEKQYFCEILLAAPESLESNWQLRDKKWGKGSVTNFV